MFDWDHTVDTTDPAYYKWTQWVFLQLFKAGLAERKEAPVNWCPSCMTVLANEQVIGGRASAAAPRSSSADRAVVLQDHEVRRAPARQPGAHRLVREDTEGADQNWIGRSEGAQRLSFPCSTIRNGEETGTVIDVYTTRPDTVFGATYMVLSPEHPLVDAVTTEGLTAPVDAYRDRGTPQGPGVAQKDRQDEDRRLHRGLLPEPGHGARRSPSGSPTTC
jgi:leucyl-tRNA synthetase